MRKKTKQDIPQPTRPPVKELVNEPAPILHDIRDTTLTERAKLLYTAIMSAIATGDSATDVLRFLSQFQQNLTLTGNKQFDITVLDILKDIAKEQEVILDDNELLMCLSPKLIKNEQGKQETIFLNPTQIKKAKKIAEKLQRKIL
jgi:hypothetical protein